MSTPTADAFLASTTFIMHANLLLAQVQGLGAEAPHNKVKGMMCLWQKWYTMQGGGITWKRDGELLEWCMVWYRDNLGAEWLAPFTNDFAPPAPSFDEELEALLAEEKPLVVSMATKGLKALACEGLGLEEATGAGEGSWQGQEEEEEGTKETTPDTMASAAMGAATPAPRKAPMGGAKGLASPAKNGSPTKPSAKHRGCLVLRYEAPMQQDFSDKKLAHLLALKWVEAVVDMGVEAGVVLKETKGKATVDLVMCQAFKEERGACDKCWVDNDPEGCWYPVGALPCFRCMAMKRPCTLDGAKTQECGNAPDLTMEKTYHQVVLVRRVQAVVEKAQKAEARGEAVGISKKSLALPTRQEDEGRGSGKGKQKASPPLSPMDKGKKRVRVLSPVVVTPEVELEEDDEDKACCLSVAIEASKAAPGMEDLAGPSRQAEVPQDVGALPEEMEWDKAEEGAEARLEATLQAQPWGWGSPQWSWLPEWSANDPATWDVSSGNESKSWEPRRRVTARFDPQWTSPPAPRVTEEALEWLGEDLAHSVVPLQPVMFLERMRAWTAQIERLLERERKAVWAELMGLRLQYSMLQRSMEMLRDYQEDVMHMLEWQEENNVQEGDLLLLHDPSLPSDND
ncbi:hypothetical protein C0993_009416 [Termitomyces sp. T159_Od127]|nr:hypothetical protein C0993_009416 [Termitomyces sp. T159_Od127]